MTFLDSNVFVYAVDTRDAEKQKIAKSIVMSARDSAEYVISAQVLTNQRLPAGEWFRRNENAKDIVSDGRGA